MNEDFPEPSLPEKVDQQPATAKTKGELLDILKTKAGAGDYHKGIFLFSALRIKTEPDTVYGVTYVLDKDRESNNGAVNVASVTRTISQSSGLDEQTSYSFTLTPDQTIEAEKDVRIADPQEFRKHMDDIAQAHSEQDPEKIMDWQDAADKKISDHEHGRDIARKIGMSFFSEQEALDLLEKLKQAELVDLTIEGQNSATTTPDSNT